MSDVKVRTRSQIGRQSRIKGATYEREIAKLMQPIFPGARRGIGQSRTGGDVPDVEGCGVYWVQTKHEKRPNVWAALAQAETELKTRAQQVHTPSQYSVAVVVARKSGEGRDLVALNLTDFLNLLNESRGTKNEIF